ncbi:MAG: hypothetical protein ACRCYY_14245 [Trueperaceae bacterium]
MPIENVLLFCTTAVLMICTPILIGYFSGQLGDRLSKQSSISRIMKWVSGSVLVGLGVRMALPERKL